MSNKGLVQMAGVLAVLSGACASQAAALDDKKPTQTGNEGTAELKTGTAVGQRIPSFKEKLTRLVDDTLATGDFDSSKTEKPTAYIFVSQTCPYTGKYAGRMKSIMQKYGDRVDVVVVYPMHAETAKSKIDYQKKNGWTSAMIDDADSSMAKGLKISKTPEIVFCSKSGEILFRGGIDEKPENAAAVKSPFLANAIDQHLNGEKVKVTTSPLFG